MKKILSSGVVLMIFALSILGQTTKSDLEQLRKEVGLPASVSVAKNETNISSSKITKIYLAIKHSKKSAKSFISWVEQWNKTNAGQFGELQIVDNLSDADIAAVQYQSGSNRIVREESVKLKTGKIPRESESGAISKNDRFVLNSIGNSKVRVESSVENLKLPLYSYFIVREGNSSWFVNYSRVDDRISEENFPELLLQSTIEDQLKSR